MPILKVSGVWLVRPYTVKQHRRRYTRISEFGEELARLMAARGLDDEIAALEPGRRAAASDVGNETVERIAPGRR